MSDISDRSGSGDQSKRSLHHEQSDDDVARNLPTAVIPDATRGLAHNGSGDQLKRSFHHEQSDDDVASNPPTAVVSDATPGRVHNGSGGPLKRSLHHEQSDGIASNPPTAVISDAARGQARFRAFLRSLVTVDHTQIALIPGMRTAIVIIMEWIIFGIGNSNSTAFQLGALYVGLTDANGSLGHRLHAMGLTLISVVIMGTMIPSLLYESIVGSIIAAACVAFLTGCSPLFGDATLVLSMKLGAALFAIQGSLHRNNDGYNGTANAVLWTLFGGSCSLLAALLPEFVGNRDAIRTDMFKVWYGFGSNLERWSAQWGTLGHTGHTRVPTVTLSICGTLDFIEQDQTEDPQAKAWLLRMMEHADTIRTASLCLSNGYEMVRQHRQSKAGNGCKHATEEDRIMDTLFRAMGHTVRDVGYAFQFPWVVRYVPYVRMQLQKRAIQLDQAAAEFYPSMVAGDVEVVEVAQASMRVNYVPSLVSLLQSEVKASLQTILDTEQFPPFSSPSTLLQRIRSAFPSKLPKPNADPGWAVRGYAVRFAVAFTLASLPEILAERNLSAHWFPMTVALIMGPRDAATYDKVAHRTIGTLFGIGLGAAISPLFSMRWALIILLGLNTYAVCIFLPANYALFTFFVTSWVFCTSVGVGAPMGVTIFYRCLWTLSAAALVLVVNYTSPPQTEFSVTTKLAAFARAIQGFTEAVVKEHDLLKRYRDEEGNNSNAHDQRAMELKQATEQVQETRKEAICTRLDLFTYMHDAVLCPTKGYRIDPHTVAPLVGSALIDAVVIPQFLALVKDESCDSLLSDLKDLRELERLIQRLETQAALPPGKPIPYESPPNRSINEGQGPFQEAILRAHQRLDEAGVPQGGDVDSSTGVNSRADST